MSDDTKSTTPQIASKDLEGIKAAVERAAEKIGSLGLTSALARGFSEIHLSGYPHTGWYQMPSFVDYLLDRYPRDFVEMVCEGADANVLDGIEHFPLLDSCPRPRAEMVATIYAFWPVRRVTREDIDALGDAAGLPSDFAEGKYNQDKEIEKARESRDARHERRSNQPWRKRHR